MLSTIFIAFLVSGIATMIFLFVAMKMINKKRRKYFEMGMLRGYVKGYQDCMKGERPKQEKDILEDF